MHREYAKLQLLDKNARYMRAPVFQQLVDNLKRDGVLTQYPAIYQETVYSGNHRVQAAIKAGLVSGDVIEIVGELGAAGEVVPISHDRLVAIQLSHNSLSGEDDPNLLASLYEELPLDYKTYSGITDDMLKRDEIDLSALSAGGIQYQEVLLTFLPEDAQSFTDLIERIGKMGQKAQRTTVLAAHLSDWSAVFDSLVRVKDTLNVKNTAIAFRCMAELAAEKLTELEAQEASDATQPGNEAAGK